MMLIYILYILVCLVEKSGYDVLKDKGLHNLMSAAIYPEFHSTSATWSEAKTSTATLDSTLKLCLLSSMTPNFIKFLGVC